MKSIRRAAGSVPCVYAGSQARCRSKTREGRRIALPEQAAQFSCSSLMALFSVFLHKYFIHLPIALFKSVCVERQHIENQPTHRK